MTTPRSDEVQAALKSFQKTIDSFGKLDPAFEQPKVIMAYIRDLESQLSRCREALSFYACCTEDWVPSDGNPETICRPIANDKGKFAKDTLASLTCEETPEND